MVIELGQSVSSPFTTATTNTAWQYGVDRVVFSGRRPGSDILWIEEQKPPSTAPSCR